MPNKVHRAAAGDSWNSLSIRYFGEPSQSGRVKSANPGVLEPFSPGATIIIPSDAPDNLGTETDGLVLRIGGVSFKHVTKLTLTRRIDAVDTVEVISPQAATDPFEDLITPLSFRSLDVAESGELIFRGTMVTVVPRLTMEGSMVRFGGYSLPGVLSDCSMPVTDKSVEFRNMNLRDIASQLVEPFSLKLQSPSDVGGPFRRVKLKREDKVLTFLARLAKQRQLLIRSSPNGELVLAAPPELAKPVATFQQDAPPVLGIEPTFSPQNYYSHTTVTRTNKRGRPGGKHTVVNQLAIDQGVVRPIAISIRDITRGELPKAAAAAAGRMLAGAVTYSLKLATWRDPNGGLWVPGTTVELEAPSVFVRRPYQFQIRSVKFDRDGKKDTATLSLMLPGAFGGTPPAVLPWS